MINFSNNEVILTVETIWAGFTINMKKDWNLSNEWIDIIDYNWTKWFWYDMYDSWYTWILKSMWNDIQLVSETKDINVNWEKNVFVYKIKYWAKIDVVQSSWNYNVDTRFEFVTNY